MTLRDGSTLRSRGKTSEAETYQDNVRTIARTGRPSGWTVPVGQFVRVKFWFYLNPDIDCDNVKKLVIDGLAQAIPTNRPGKMLNDRWVLTCDVAKERAVKGQQRLVLEIDLATPHT